VLLAQWSPNVVFIYATVFVLFVIVISAVLIQRRKTAWQRFARKHGLRYEAGSDGLAVYGRIENRGFQLGTLSSAGSDTGALGIEEIQMSLEVHGEIPQGLELSEGGAIVGGALKMVEENIIETGDDEFDRAVVVRGNRADEVLRYLTPARKQAVLRLSSVAAGTGDATFGMANSKVHIRQRDRISRSAELDRGLARLIAAARELDGDRPNRDKPGMV
jgi:hypothetical protein